MRLKFATVGLFAVALMAPFASADEAEDKAVAAIKKLGGKIERDEKRAGRPVVAVDLFDKRITDAGLKDPGRLRAASGTRT